MVLIKETSSSTSSCGFGIAKCAIRIPTGIGWIADPGQDCIEAYGKGYVNSCCRQRVLMITISTKFLCAISSANHCTETCPQILYTHKLYCALKDSFSLSRQVKRVQNEKCKFWFRSTIPESSNPVFLFRLLQSIINMLLHVDDGP